MAAIKNQLRCCKYCSYKKPYIKKLCYYCDNKKSEHYLEEFKDDTEIRYCKGGNDRNAYSAK